MAVTVLSIVWKSGTINLTVSNVLEQLHGFSWTRVGNCQQALVQALEQTVDIIKLQFWPAGVIGA